MLEFINAGDNTERQNFGRVILHIYVLNLTGFLQMFSYNQFDTYLESISCPDVFQLLADFCWSSVQLLSNGLLLAGFQCVELLTQVSVQHILDGKF